MNFIPKLDVPIVVKDVFSKDEISDIHNLIGKEEKDALVYSKEDNEYIKDDERTAKFLKLVDNNWVKNKILDVVGKVNIEHWKFNLTGMMEEQIVIKYNKEDYYDWHLDIGEVVDKEIPNMRKISYSIILNDEFGGGGLEFKTNSKKKIYDNLPIGTGVLFPSYLAHKVNPVISGTRWALVGWIHGNPFV